MARVTLAVAPTFNSVVEIPGPGAKSLKIDFVFRHRTQDELEKWRKTLVDADGKTRPDVDVIMDLAEGWTNVEEPFGADSIVLMCQNYHAAASTIVARYLAELVEGRKGN